MNIVENSDASKDNAVFYSEDLIRAQLVRTWHAFFARFPRLQRIQSAAIPVILKGKSALLNAPTASGKTEAVMAPLVERLLNSLPPYWREEKEKCLRILVVAPTRALCNDLFRRLQTPIKSFGLTIAIKTGDSPNFNSDIPPQILITTPESLDSLLSRQPTSFRFLMAMFMDEIHLVAQTGRGDQLQCLVKRIRAINETPVQFCAASATISESEPLKMRFLGEDAKVITVSHSMRQINSSLTRCLTESDVAQCVAGLVNENARRKVLVFANSRAQVENLVAELSESPNLSSRIFAHHGSLSRQERLRSEHQFLLTQNGACIATSTLELGIDIGDVDRTVLVGPPPDVSSLIQRIGRGNRKDKQLYVKCIYESLFERKRFEHLLQCAANDMIFADPVAIRPTVLAQQALSLCFQNPKRWISPRSLYDHLSPAAQELYTREDCEKILLKQTENGLFRSISQKKFIPEPKAEFIFERGFMQSMIEDKNETDVVDAVTGRTIGSVRLSHQNKVAISQGLKPNLLLAGKGHEVSSFKENKLFVQQGIGTNKTQFVTREPPRYSLNLAQDFAKFLNIPTGELPCYYNAELNVISICHFLGTIGAQFLAQTLTVLGCDVSPRSISPFFISVQRKPQADKLPGRDSLKTILETVIQTKTRTIARALQPGPFLNCIPDDIILKWLHASIDLDRYADAMSERNFVQSSFDFLNE